MRDYSAKLARLYEELEELQARKKRIMNEGQSWRLRNGEDSREMNNVSLAEVNRMIEKVEFKIEQLEGYGNGSGNPSGIRVKAGVL